MWGKKEKRCDRNNRADDGKGSQWDHIVLDAEKKVLVSLVIGPRTEKNAKLLFKDFAHRTDGVIPELITTDEHVAYPKAILRTYGIERPKEHRIGKRGKRCKTQLLPPYGLIYATVHKRREKGKVVDVSIHRVFGTQKKLEQSLKRSAVSKHVNTTFVERFNGTVRQYNGANVALATEYFGSEGYRVEVVANVDVEIYTK